jgi:5-methylcytosine-specific restriction enzyme subunit McrC
MKAKYSIREYGVISDGLNKDPYNSESIEVDKNTFNSLSNFIEENYENKDFESAFLIFQKGGRRHIRVKNYVGVIETKEGVAIELLPKTFRGNEPTSEEESKTLFLRLLKALRNTPFINLSTAHLKDAKDFPILEIFITTYLDELGTLINHELRGDYQGVVENVNFIKGKLLISENIKRNLFRQTYFYCAHDVFSENIPPNRIIKSTLRHLMKIARYSKNKTRIIKLLEYFKNVDFSDSLEADLNFSRGSKKYLNRYQNILLWSEIYLKNKSFTTFHGASINQAILFPMEKLFESYIAFLIKRYCNGLSIATQDKRYFLVNQKLNQDDEAFGRKLFQLRPDIVINDDFLIIDTKWKMVDNYARKYDIQEADIYQMNAYGRRYQSSNMAKRAPRLCLIYPKNPDFSENLLQMRYGDDLYLDVVPFDLNSHNPAVEIQRVIQVFFG